MYKISNVHIHSIAACVPKNTIKNIANDNNSKVIKSIGVKMRHVVNDDQSAMDLCIAAAQDIFDQTSLNAEDIGAVIFVSQTPEYQLPATACIIQSILGISNDTIAYDVNLGCSGYTHGLFLASGLIQSGVENILLLTGDTISKTIDKNDNSTSLLFGDAGCATILTRKKNSSISCVLGVDGSGFEAIIIDNKYAKRTSYKDNYLTLNGGEVFAFTLRCIPKLIKESLSFSDLEKDDISYFVFHQANLFMLKTLASSIGIDFEKFPVSIDQYGNTSSASIPLTFCHKKSIIKGKVLMAGFGVGLSWSSVIADLSDTKILNITEL
jgi:3-oxoacyl-[acyl-carrier-protein] synthase III